MAEDAVAIPLTGENLVPQGVRDATTRQQQQQQQQQAITKPTKQQIANQLQGQAIHGFVGMEQLIQASALMLQYIHNNPNERLTNPILAGYVHQVKTFASSQGERTDMVTQFKGLLEQVQQDVTVIRTTTEQTASSVTTGMSSDSAVIWRAHQGQAWQAAIRSAASPQSQSQSVGSSSPGVSHAELGMDCEIVVKIRDDSDCQFVKKLQPRDIVMRAERARAHAAKSTPSLPLAGHAFTAARQLPSGEYCRGSGGPPEALRELGPNVWQLRVRTGPDVGNRH